MNVLVINCGSSSIKYQLRCTGSGDTLLRGLIERVAAGGHRAAVDEILAAVGDKEVDAVGHRVVHGGAHFKDAALIDVDVIAAIKSCIPLAPLHNPNNLAGIEAAREKLPQVPHVAVFDTAFHGTLPRRARHYAIDPDLAQKHSLYRFGFHGTSHAYVAAAAAEYLGRPIASLRLISVHLGNGASACAIECGHSVETSMGTTPLEGLVMGTRCGDIDAGALLLLQQREGLSAAELDALLNRQSGLAGLSGAGNDLRDIEEKAAEGDDRCRLAIAVFAHRVRKYIGAYAATMGGVDAVILTGGIGQNSAQMRRRILQRFEFLGLLLDEEVNGSAQVGPDCTVVDVAAKNAGVAALVIATDEESVIARQTADITDGLSEVKERAPLPIAVSARHVHLNAESMAALFGDDVSLTPYKELSQPGQYAAEQKVDLIGPRGRIDGVRILGPLRSRNQVEISRTDEFKLGVDAPVRMSGNTEGSAPITLQGPAGTLQLSEGLICAWRHIHMTPQDAEAWGVQAGDEVEVAITGGDRDLTFGDVVVRVSEKYATEMHVDTDEANAAELRPKDAGELVTVAGAGAQLRRRRPHRASPRSESA